jgi:putative FmdB family regulatory protein
MTGGVLIVTTRMRGPNPHNRHFDSAVLVSRLACAGGTPAAAVVEKRMPTYTYRCEKCNAVFDHVEHVQEHEAARYTESNPLRCPKCGSPSVAHHPTTFVPRTSKKS